MNFPSKKELSEIYNENWCRDYITDEALSEQIRTLASLGAYETCIYVDSNREYDALLGRLVEAGYSVKDYNGGNNGILKINFAS